MSILVTPRPGNHDPSLPDWGPYSKKYFGISHIADKADALRFDAFVMPQLSETGGGNTDQCCFPDPDLR